MTRRFEDASYDCGSCVSMRDANVCSPRWTDDRMCLNASTEGIDRSSLIWRASKSIFLHPFSTNDPNLTMPRGGEAMEAEGVD